MTARRLAVKEEACVGGGQCVLAAPAVFDQDEDTGLVILLTDRPPAGTERSVEDAVALCPARALTFGTD